MNMKTTHSPIPWLARTYGNARGQLTTIKIWAETEWKGRMVCAIAAGDCTLNREEDCANAHFIVRACNSQEELLKVCRAAMDEACRDNRNQALIDQLAAAIAGAENEEGS